MVRKRKLSTALALLAAKNEKRHINFTISALIKEGLDVVLLDDGSTDGTRELAQEFLGKGLLEIRSRPDQGVYDWTSVLKWKKKVSSEFPHKWLVHVDADEWLQHPQEGMTLLDLITEADSVGANAIDFEEFTFIPKPELEPGGDPRATFRSYYWHRPVGFGYLRAWKNGLGLSNIKSGGHGLNSSFFWARSSIKEHSKKGILRHYPILSEEHLREKYGKRVFAQRELDRGWHADRLKLSEWSLSVFGNPHIFVLDKPSDKNFNRSNPINKHFWYEDWPKNPCG
jgi:glycosyltransferase involved in cell wall biosynthesis